MTIECPACKKQVPAEAESCPFCGGWLKHKTNSSFDPEQQRVGILWNRRFLANVITGIATLAVSGGMVYIFEGDGLIVGLGIIASAFPIYGIASGLRQAIDNAESLHRIEKLLGLATIERPV